MALDKPGLKATILSILTDMEGRTEDAKEEFATRLSDAIDVFVKTGKVTVEAGIKVDTTGSATAQTGATSTTGTGTIS